MDDVVKVTSKDLPRFKLHDSTLERLMAASDPKQNFFLH